MIVGNFKKGGIKMLKEEKQAIIAEYATHEGDTGSPEVQIALLSKRISDLTEHLKANEHDHASRRGLLMLVAKRRKMLDYAKRTNPDLYKDLLVRLSLRH